MNLYTLKKKYPIGTKLIRNFNNHKGYKKHYNVWIVDGYNTSRKHLILLRSDNSNYLIGVPYSNLKHYKRIK